MDEFNNENLENKEEQKYNYGNYETERRIQEKKENNYKKSRRLITIVIATTILTLICICVKQKSTINILEKQEPEISTDTTKATVVESSESKSTKETVDNSNKVIEEIDKKDISVTAYDISELVESTIPCVVAVTDNLKITEDMSNYFYYFRGFNFGNNGNNSQTSESTSSGSGVIISQDENYIYIVTNNHVIDNDGNYQTYTVESTGINVMFCNEVAVNAEILGTDEGLDIAVIRVNKSELAEETIAAIKIADIGDSDSLKVGNGVYVIGNALGYGQSVTSGIISATNRAINYDGETRYLIQTDAAINAGNSGGGLFNMDGELVGINSAKYSATYSDQTSIEGMGFAIPMAQISERIEEILSGEVEITEKKNEAYLGVYTSTVPDTYVIFYGYPSGASISYLDENGPAIKAGVRQYDIITAIDGTAITSSLELTEYLENKKIGDTITLTISRQKQMSNMVQFEKVTIDVTLTEKSDTVSKEAA